MLTKNSDIEKMVLDIITHYKNNIATKYIKPSFSLLDLTKSDLDNIEIFTEKNEMYKYQGYYLDELYIRYLSLARFIHQAQKIIVPNAKAIALRSLRSPQNPQEKILAEMVGINFESNLKVLKEQLKALFSLTVKEDENLNNGKAKVLLKIPEMTELELLLK
jgi:hypothetical protein